ncbi:UNVERIFIED_CONTAM: Auxin transporter-like protein 2 [Sesamum angustifolium]|uniref:Auxin transporter-like protein 2 n=1 Tax=Sesamum angustifolium TaxID=2727405 RepID=A0AAW2N3V3_9LAMI
MLAQKQAEEAISTSMKLNHDGGGKERGESEEHSMFSVKACSGTAAPPGCLVAQVLLTLPYSFSQLGMLLESFFKYSTVWLAAGPLILSVFIHRVSSSKGKEGVSFKTMSLFEVMDYLAHTGKQWVWLQLLPLRICHPTHSLRQVEDVQHSGPKKLVLYFTGATNILYTFGGHAVTVEIMHAMWKPQKFKYIYLLATLYVFTLTLPSASAVYWAFGDQLLNHANAFSLLPKNGWRDAAVILMLIHQFITFGFACTPLYFVWEKVIGMHDTKSICLRALARLPVVIPIWFLAIIFPFFGPINSAVGALLVSFTVYIIPALAHMLTYRKASARQNAAEKPPAFMPSWAAMYAINTFVVIWILVVGFGFGGWASVTNFVRQVDTFGLFAKCYQCKPAAAPHH